MCIAAPGSVSGPWTTRNERLAVASGGREGSLTPAVVRPLHEAGFGSSPLRPRERNHLYLLLKWLPG